MTERSPCILGDFRLGDGENDQRTACVAECPLIEAKVARDKRWISLPCQEWADFIVRQAPSPDVTTNVTSTNTPAAQLLNLRFKDVFIEDIHVRAGTST
jgi:hypothetical protein